METWCAREKLIETRIEERPMSLRLVANGDGRAVAIRDHVMPLLRQRGAVQVQRDTVRITELQTGVWAVRVWTPFNELGPEEASSPGYRHAMERQRTRKVLPYGLEIWHGATRVLRILWSDDECTEVANFVRGQWEDEVFLLE
jgi:hypothetical protein